MNDQNREEYEVQSQLWYWEQSYLSGKDYVLKQDEAYIQWLDDRMKENIAAQIEETL